MYMYSVLWVILLKTVSIFFLCRFFFKVSIILVSPMDFSSIFIVFDVAKNNFLESRLSLSFIFKSLQLSISKPVKTEQNSHWNDRPLIIRYVYIHVQVYMEDSKVYYMYFCIALTSKKIQH